MALMITEECIACGACESGCPNNAIFAGESKYEINHELCTECVGYYDEPQCKLICPMQAIVTNPAYQETREELLKKKESISKS